jgi:hypothetical protein
MPELVQIMTTGPGSDADKTGAFKWGFQLIVTRNEVSFQLLVFTLSLALIIFYYRVSPNPYQNRGWFSVVLSAHPSTDRPRNFSFSAYGSSRRGLRSGPGCFTLTSSFGPLDVLLLLMWHGGEETCSSNCEPDDPGTNLCGNPDHDFDVLLKAMFIIPGYILRTVSVSCVDDVLLLDACVNPLVCESLV